MCNRQLSAVVNHIAIDAVGLWFDSQAGLMGHSFATAATFFWSCGVQALNRGDEPCH